MSDLNDIGFQIKEWLSAYLNNHKLNSFVVGVSGGVDSALTSTLCALTGATTYIVGLPLLQDSSQLELSRAHMNWLKQKFNNVKILEIDLTKLFLTFSELFEPSFQSELGLANSRSRIRMVTLYQIASSVNGVVVGTGNKVEDFGVGFFTKYGDGGVDISPIADLMKTEVRELAKMLGVIDEIVYAPPTDGLWRDNRTDEQQIGATYEELEWAMSFLESGSNTQPMLDERQLTVLDIYRDFNNRNKHKMIPVPIFKKK